MQNVVKLNDTIIKQPNKGLEFSFETTFTDDTERVITGALNLTPMFTVEAFSYEASDLTVEEMTTILQIVAKGKKFKLHYLSPYYGTWRDDYFYVGKGGLSIGSWQANKERYDSLQIQMTGVNPI